MMFRCQVRGERAMVVGYCPGKKGKIYAIVALGGKLRAVKLKHIELVDEHEDKVVDLRAAS
jgi:hypothetical protein